MGVAIDNAPGQIENHTGNTREATSRVILGDASTDSTRERAALEKNSIDNLALLQRHAETLRTDQNDNRHSTRRMRQIERDCTTVLESNPEPVLGQLSLLVRGIARARMKHWVRAKKDLEDVLAQIKREGDNVGLEKLAIAWLASAKRALKPWNLTLRAGLSYDSNVPQVDRNVPTVRTFDRKSDRRTDIGVDASYRLIQLDEITLKVSASASGSWHQHLDLFDSETYGGALALGYQLTDRLALNLEYDYDLNRLGREQYLSRHRITPAVLILEDGGGATTFFYQFDTGRYFDVPAITNTGPFDRSGDTHVFGVSHLFVIRGTDERDVLLSLGYRHENVSTEGTEYDARYEVLSATLVVPLRARFELSVFGEWSWDDYKNDSVLDRRERGRSDFLQTYGIILSKQMTDHVSVQGHVFWSSNDSNVRSEAREPVYSFDRTIAGVSVVVTF